MYNNPFNSWIDKKRRGINEWISFKTKTLEVNVKVELHFSNYATKADLKNATGTDTSDFAKNTDLANIKSDVDNIDIDKLKKCTKQFKQFEK